MQPHPELGEGPLSSQEEPVLIISREGRIHFLNTAAQVLYGLAIGASLPHSIPSTDEDEVCHDQQRLHLTRQPVEWMGAAAWMLTITKVTPESSHKQRQADLEDANRRLTRENRRLNQLIQQDPLTGLLNRRGLTERLSSEQTRLTRGAGALSAILIDLDDFKALNDSLGYGAGDRALISVANIMREALRPSDILSRIGGDEFLVLLPDTGPQVAMGVAQRLRQSIENLEASALTASMGVRELTTNTLPLSDILQHIHSSLSASKFHGKNCVTHITHEERPEGTARFSPIWTLDTTTMIAEACEARLGGGLDSALLLLDACVRRPGALPLHLPLPPQILLHQTALLKGLPKRRRWAVTLSEASLIDEVLPLRPVVAWLRAHDIGLNLGGITGGRRGLEAMALLRPDSITLHPRQLSSRTPGALERLCAVATALDCSILAGGIDSPEALKRAHLVGIIGGTGRMLTRDDIAT